MPIKSDRYSVCTENSCKVCRRYIDAASLKDGQGYFFCQSLLRTEHCCTRFFASNNNLVPVTADHEAEFASLGADDSLDGACMILAFLAIIGILAYIYMICKKLTERNSGIPKVYRSWNETLQCT